MDAVRFELVSVAVRDLERHIFAAGEYRQNSFGLLHMIMQPVLLKFFELCVRVAIRKPGGRRVRGVDPKQLVPVIFCKFPRSHEAV